MSFPLRNCLAAAFLVMAALSPALPHDWYPSQCCNGSEHGGDCHPVPCESLTENSDGTVTWREFTFKPLQVHPSQDRTCHACVFRDITPMCVFVQQSS